MKDRFRPRFELSPDIYRERGDLIDDGDQVCIVYRNVSSLNRLSEKPNFGK